MNCMVPGGSVAVKSSHLVRFMEEIILFRFCDERIALPSLHRVSPHRIFAAGQMCQNYYNGHDKSIGIHRPSVRIVTHICSTQVCCGANYLNGFLYFKISTPARRQCGTLSLRTVLLYARAHTSLRNGRSEVNNCTAWLSCARVNTHRGTKYLQVTGSRTWAVVFLGPLSNEIFDICTYIRFMRHLRTEMSCRYELSIFLIFIFFFE